MESGGPLKFARNKHAHIENVLDMKQTGRPLKLDKRVQITQVKLWLSNQKLTVCQVIDQNIIPTEVSIQSVKEHMLNYNECVKFGDNGSMGYIKRKKVDKNPSNTEEWNIY